MGKKKHLCKLDKDDIKDDRKELLTLILPPKYICAKCARVANKKACLCKGEPIGTKE